MAWNAHGAYTLTSKDKSGRHVATGNLDEDGEREKDSDVVVQTEPSFFLI